MTADPKLELKLMTEIRDEWGEAISAACQASSVPPAFIAALIAGESGGKIDAKRFEPGSLHALWEVLLGRKAAYGSIGRYDLLLYVLPASVPALSRADAISGSALSAVFTAAFQHVDDLATSWGLTQVMGWHVLERWAGIASTLDLALPARSLPLSLRLLAQFALRFQLSLARDFSEMFSCWNTGQPNGKTADPEYIPRGIARMALYGQLPPAVTAL
jgi:hypothetical protein